MITTDQPCLMLPEEEYPVYQALWYLTDILKIISKNLTSYTQKYGHIKTDAS